MSIQRILFICLSKPSRHQSAIGGMEQQVLRLSKLLSADKRFCVGLIAGQHLLDSNTNAASNFPADTTLSRRSAVLSDSLQASIETFKPDIIHCHGLKAAQALMKLSKKTKLGAPHLNRAGKVLTVHGDKTKLNWTKWFDHLIAVSPPIEAELSQHTSTCTYIPNAIAPLSERQLQSSDATTKQQLIAHFGFDPNKPLCVAVGRLAKVKQYDLLMAAFRDVPANLLIVGDGPEHPKLKRLQTQHIKLAGYRQDARDIIACADALMINSKREGLSLSMLEALEADTAVLSPPVSGTHLLPEEALLHQTGAKNLAKEITDKLTRLKDIKQKQRVIYAQEQDALSVEAMLSSTIKVYQMASHIPPKLLFLGDCNTCGTAALHQQHNEHGEARTYAEIVAQNTNKSELNCGLTMSTTREALQYFARHEHPSLETVFIQYGLVDSWQTIKAAPYVLYYPDTPSRRFLRRWVKKWKKYGRKFGLGRMFGMQHQVPLDEYTSNIEHIIHACAQNGTKVVLIETAPNHDQSRNSAIKAYNAALKELAERHNNCTFVEVYTAFEQQMDAYYMDPTHFSAAGHAYLAQRVLQVLKG